MSWLFLSTRGGNRTHTPKELDFESSASTSSATRAVKNRTAKLLNIFFLHSKNNNIYPLATQINF
jgi:hypothetical protein